jgi:sensor histidine kinase regulating citrate/malate metabolism
MINNYIENNDYDKLKAYLDISISEIENSYSKINTGNLVIDSFVSNYNNLCEENKIHFVTDLSVDYNRIPISDYDLCIILGNILDNALNACSLNNGKENFIKLTIIITDNDIFYIHTENTFNRFIKKEKRNRAYPFFEHGYGINNVEKIVQNNHGIININADDLFRIDIVLPITDDSKRITPPPPKHPLL